MWTSLRWSALVFLFLAYSIFYWACSVAVSSVLNYYYYFALWAFKWHAFLNSFSCDSWGARLLHLMDSLPSKEVNLQFFFNVFYCGKSHKICKKCYCMLFWPYLAVQFSGTNYVHIVCKSHHHPSPEFFSFLNWNSVPIKHCHHLPSPLPPPQPLTSTKVVSESVHLTVLCSSYKWSQILFVCTWYELECIFKVNLIYVLQINYAFFFPPVLYSMLSLIIYFIHSINSIGLPWSLRGKESICNVRDPGSIPGLGGNLEKEVAIHSSVLAWNIPWTEERGNLQLMGFSRVRHDLETKPQPPHQ